MDRQDYHEMVLETTHSTGAEEWYCPTCGRRFLLRWPPTYEKIIIEPGDEQAAHSGSKGPLLRMGGLEISDTSERAADEELLGDMPVRPHTVDDTPPITYSPVDEELGDTPITDELRPWLKLFDDDKRTDQ